MWPCEGSRSCTIVVARKTVLPPWTWRNTTLALLAYKPLSVFNPPGFLMSAFLYFQKWLRLFGVFNLFEKISPLGRNYKVSPHEASKYFFVFALLLTNISVPTASKAKRSSVHEKNCKIALSEFSCRRHEDRVRLFARLSIMDKSSFDRKMNESLTFSDTAS